MKLPISVLLVAQLFSIHSAQALELSEFTARSYSGTALGIHPWGRQLQGAPTSCGVQLSDGAFEGHKIGVNMKVDAVTRQGEHRRGYFFYEGVGDKWDRLPEEDPNNWKRAQRNGNTLTLETMQAAYGAEKIVHSDYTVMTMQISPDYSQIGNVAVRMQRTYTKFAIEFDRAMREAGYPGDDLLDPERVGQPVEVMNASCESFTAH